MQDKPLRFIRYAWFNLGYLIFVILWGAWVRISKSGAGCGNHWPTCNGEVIPMDPTWHTLVEFTHRLTSGLSLPFVLVLMFWAFKRFPKGHAVRWSTLGCLIFLLSESALGAGLVKFELVAENTSVERAIVASMHLVNTFTLTAFAFLTGWWAKHGPPEQGFLKSPLQKGFLGGLLALFITCMSGAVTALGDTLFPTTLELGSGLWTHLSHEMSASMHFLVRLRAIHPILALLSAFYLFYLSFKVRERPLKSHQILSSFLMTGLIFVQLGLGSLNILWGAPTWTQLTHLGLALGLFLSTLALWVDGSGQTV